MGKSTSDIFTEWLVLGCKQGDKVAFERLVKQWQPKVMNQAYWYCKNGLAAKDIAQETWTSVVQGIGKLNDPARFSIWLHQIVYRKSVDWIRQTKKIRELNIYEAKQSMHPETQDDGRLKLMMELLHKLPEDQKIILTLFYLNEQNIIEISEILGIPIGTVKSRLFNAREHLKLKLKDKTYEKKS